MTTAAGTPGEGSTSPTIVGSSVVDDSDESTVNDISSWKRKNWKIMSFFLALLLMDLFFIEYLLIPYFQPSWLRQAMDWPSAGSNNYHYTFFGSLVDLAILSIVRLIAIVWAIVVSYQNNGGGEEEEQSDSTTTNNLFHPNGDKKSQEELDEEALEEPFYPWIIRFVHRPAFVGEVLAAFTQLFCIIKCLVRMEIELDRYHSKHNPIHPMFWIVIILMALVALVEIILLDTPMCQLAKQYGKLKKKEQQERRDDDASTAQTAAVTRSATAASLASGSDDESDLRTPLLMDGTDDDDAETNNGVEATTMTNIDDDDVEANNNITNGNTNEDSPEEEAEDRPVASEIRADTTYKASWKDLLFSCAPDLPLILSGFVFLILAAIAEVCIPRFLGNILDALSETFGGHNNNNHKHDDMSMWDVPGFLTNIQLLLVAAILAGVFAGIRAAVFTIAGGRVNIRLRIQLMDSLMSQDVSFFDMTKTGDITSRLSSDTTLVGNQAIRSIDVLFKCLAHSLGVLVFMFVASWQLTILAFITFPLTAMISKWYGNYMRLLSKLMQKKLADGNSISEMALSSMATVRSFDAAESELQEFATCMNKYLYLQRKNSIAFGSFITLLESVPQLVYAVVVFYGGLQVRNGDLTVGELVSFLLYLQSLSDEFAAIGYVFGNLTQAVGAADKIFELMNREPKYTRPSTTTPSPGHQSQQQQELVLGVKATKTLEQRTTGLWPNERAGGRIELENVQMHYAARPQKRVLNDVSLKVPAGSTVAVVGKSGSGKSSIMSLIQHLYEPTSGRILLDGKDVLELAPGYLSRNVSIVSQEPTLFARSIKKNIIYGLEGTTEEPTEEEIVRAAKLANADDFIQKMPQKYDTEVGERGIQLSGGQKQRIAIARALVRHPRILLLDEATSALDAESEHLVQQAIDDMLAKSKAERGAMTVLIVAHRLSTVRNADTIFVMDEGRVVEEGHHSELLEKVNGAYSALVHRQMEAQQKLDEYKTNGHNLQLQGVETKTEGTTIVKTNVPLR